MPDRPETLARVRFEGPSDDADGNPRPDNYVTTAEGITVGDTLADLKVAYGSNVGSGSSSEQAYYRWPQKYGGMSPQVARQVKALERENARLKCLVADQALDMQILKEAARPNL